MPPPDAGLVAVLGSLNMDVVLRTPRLPTRGETVAATGSFNSAGGKGANQAAAAARAGAATLMIGAVGDDAFGKELLDSLIRFGVDVARVRRLAEASTGTAYVVVETSGENLIIVDGGANRLVDPAMTAAPSGAAVRLAQLETPLAAVEAFLKAKGGVAILNAAPFTEGARALFDLVDVLIVNETELAGYAGPGDTATAARALLSRPGQTVVVTLGAEGALAVDGAGALSVLGLPAKVVDTTGAGDCFCGVFAASLARDATILEALQRANVAGALAVGRLGAQSSLPSAEEIHAACARALA